MPRSGDQSDRKENRRGEKITMQTTEQFIRDQQVKLEGRVRKPRALSVGDVWEDQDALRRVTILNLTNRFSRVVYLVVTKHGINVAQTNRAAFEYAFCHKKLGKLSSAKLAMITGGLLCHE